jgi:hypothetical protein
MVIGFSLPWGNSSHDHNMGVIAALDQASHAMDVRVHGVYAEQGLPCQHNCPVCVCAHGVDYHTECVPCLEDPRTVVLCRTHGEVDVHPDDTRDNCPLCVNLWDRSPREHGRVAYADGRRI